MKTRGIDRQNWFTFNVGHTSVSLNKTENAGQLDLFVKPRTRDPLQQRIDIVDKTLCFDTPVLRQMLGVREALNIKTICRIHYEMHKKDASTRPDEMPYSNLTDLQKEVAIGLIRSGYHEVHSFKWASRQSAEDLNTRIIRLSRVSRMIGSIRDLSQLLDTKKPIEEQKSYTDYIDEKIIFKDDIIRIKEDELRCRKHNIIETIGRTSSAPTLLRLMKGDFKIDKPGFSGLLEFVERNYITAAEIQKKAEQQALGLLKMRIAKIRSGMLIIRTDNQLLQWAAASGRIKVDQKFTTEIIDKLTENYSRTNGTS